ncbi:hypothetical protein PENANT_c173G08555 [Penicillium antarcticum]|uniref:NADP-dependent oxidoreductase domain-containing protein n=1 Tax=Penicillium antarcticum TaxID=416450 RepID=A0A1V6PCB5_9EURO|nr:hypothetical protein PENANT_c173G08555 [Penicillium antarcticum]
MSSNGMEYIRLGKSGLKVSKIVLGCMTYGDPNWQPWIMDEATALPLIKHAYDRGINTWDVADTYSNGRSEEILGTALKKFNIPRSKIVIMTKCFHGVDESRGPLDAAGFGINDGTYIDVLQIHRLDRNTDMEEIMRALNDVIETGKVRYIGASSMAAWEFQMLQNIAEKHGWHKFISMQGFYNLLYREEEREMFPYCATTGVGLLPWSPLAAGVLAHAWTDRSDKREQQDVFLRALFRSSEDRSAEEIVHRVSVLAHEKGISMAQVATAWVLSKESTAPILGLDSVDRIDQAVEAIKVKLTAEEVAFLEEPYLPKSAMTF